MSVDDKTKKFFLEGATEPVALEFAIEIPNSYDELLRILSENGLQVTTDPSETDKILISREGIITPPLRPEDVRPIFEILEQALHEAKCFITSTPHIIDLKTITPRQYIPQELASEQQNIRAKYKDELVGGETSFEEHMINEAMASDKVITMQWTGEAKLPPEILQGYDEAELVFSGSTIADPYRTATQKIERNIRMASHDPIDAVRYSHPEAKYYCHYELHAGEQRYGFFHVYKTSPDQCYYSPTGIELNQSPGSRGCPRGETMVNRFKNPCVCEYLAIKERDGSQVYYKLFPIPQDDERWQDFKKLLIHSNNTHSFASRYNALFEQRNNPQAVIPLVSEAYDEKGRKQYFWDKRSEKIKNELQNTRNSIEQILKEVEEIRKKGDDIAASEVSLEEKQQILKKLEEESKKKKEEALLRAKDIISRYNPEGYLSELKTEIQDTIQLCRSVEALSFEQKIYNLKKIEEEKRNLRKRNITDIYQHIAEHRRIPESHNLSSLHPEERADMLREIKMSLSKNINADDIENALKIYTSAQSVEERQNLFKTLDSIRFKLFIKNKKLASEISKQIKHSPKFEQYPEIVQLFKKDNIFVSHTAKAWTIVNNLTEQSSGRKYR